MADRTIEVEEMVTNEETITVCDVCGLGEDEEHIATYSSPPDTVDMHPSCVPTLSDEEQPQASPTTMQDLYQTASRENMALRESVIVLPVVGYVFGALTTVCGYGVVAAMVWTVVAPTVQIAIVLIGSIIVALMIAMFWDGRDHATDAIEEYRDRHS